MTSEHWLAIISILLTVIGTLLIIGYKDFLRRFSSLEKRIEGLERQDTKIFAAVMTLLIIKSDDHIALANALHDLLTNTMR